MDASFALRLVIFEYLLPEQARCRRRVLRHSLCSTVGWFQAEPRVEGMMEILRNLADDLLASQRFATSYRIPRIRQPYFLRRNVDAIVLAQCEEVRGSRRLADPPFGIYVFQR